MRIRVHTIGDVAIVSSPQEMNGHKRTIAEEITSRGKSIRRALNRISRIEGDERVTAFEILKEDSTITTHKEFGRFYRRDVAKVFFNAGLSYERRRMASMV
jgi:tRNA (guanine37-N1)-methyltransferase